MVNNNYLRQADHSQHPILNFIFTQFIILLCLCLGVWSVAADATTIIESEGFLLFFGILLLVPFSLIEIHFFHQFRKYGFIFVNMGIGDPIKSEPTLLIRLRDPRKKIRKSCLLKILNSWNEIKNGKKFNRMLYLRRIVFCLLDKEIEIRKIAYQILHQIFRKSNYEIRNILFKCVQSDFYLIDKTLKEVIALLEVERWVTIFSQNTNQFHQILVKIDKLHQLNVQCDLNFETFHQTYELQFDSCLTRKDIKILKKGWGIQNSWFEVKDKYFFERLKSLLMNIGAMENSIQSFFEVFNLKNLIFLRNEFLLEVTCQLRYFLQHSEPVLPYKPPKKTVGICIVCNLPIYQFEQSIQCPLCGVSAHRTHFLEWVKIKGYCTSCHRHLNLNDFSRDLIRNTKEEMIFTNIHRGI